MSSPRDRARTALSDRAIPVASVHEVLPDSGMGGAAGSRGLRRVRELDPEGEEFGVRGGMGGAWSRLEQDPAGPERGGSSGPAGVPGGPWIYLKTGAMSRGERGFSASVRRAVLILASSADVSSAASARWTGLVLEARRVSRRLREVDALPG